MLTAIHPTTYALLRGGGFLAHGVVKKCHSYEWHLNISWNSRLSYFRVSQVRYYTFPISGFQRISLLHPIKNVHGGFAAFPDHDLYCPCGIFYADFHIGFLFLGEVAEYPVDQV